MSRSLTVVALAAAAVSTAASPSIARANAPWEGPAFAARPRAIAAAAAAETAPAGATSIVLLEEQRYSLDHRGVVTVRWRRVVKVLGPEGVTSHKTLFASFNPWTDRPCTVRARTIAADGTETLLDPATVKLGDPAAEPHRNGYRRHVLATMPALAPGVVVEQAVETVEMQPRRPGGDTYRFYLNGPTRLHRVVIEAPAALPVRHRAWGAVGSPKVSTRGGRRTITYELRDAVDPDPQDALPVGGSLVPRVEVSTGASWRAVAAALRAEVEAAITGAPAAVSVPRGGERAITIAAALAALRARVEAANLDLGDAPIAPRSPATTVASGAGGSLDLAAALVAILRGAGVRAHVALVSTAHAPGVDPGLPGGGSFDHALVVVPGRTPTWVDPASDYLPAGELTAQRQGRRALILAPGTRGLVTTPIARPQDAGVREVRRYDLRDFGPARVREVATYRGGFAQFMRARYATGAPDAMRRELAEYAQKEYLAQGPATVRWSPPDDLSTRFELTSEVTRSDRALCGVDDCTVVTPTDDIFAWLPTLLTDPDKADEATRRTRDFAALHLHQNEVSYQLHLPDGWLVVDPPAPERRDLGGAEYRVDVTRTGDTLTVRHQFTLHQRRFTADQLRALRAALAPLVERAAPAIELRHRASTLATEGKVPQALGELRRLTAAQPDNPTQRWRLVSVLLDIGLRDAAVSEAKIAVSMDHSARSYAFLGWALAHDELGRELERGYRRNRAIQALRTAARLDPGDAWNHGFLGRVLVHDAEGVPYAGDLAGAAEAFGRAARLDPDEWWEAHLELLTFDRRWADITAAAAAYPGGPDRDKYLVAAEAATGTAATAADRAVELADKGDVATLIANALGKLAFAGALEPARALLAEAKRRGVTNPVLVSQHGTFAGVARWKRKLYPHNDPRRVVQMSMVTGLGLAGGTRAHRALASRDARELLDWRHDHDTLLAHAVGSTRGDAFSPQLAAALVLSRATMKVTETRPWGSRVEVQLNGDSLVAFVVREEGRLRLLSDNWAAPLAARAMRLAREGDEASARGLMTWARAMVSPGQPYTRPFDTLWKREGGRNLAALERAAAALVAAHPRAQTAIDTLGSCPAGDKAVAIACAEALVWATIAARDGDLIRAATRRFEALVPGSSALLSMRRAGASYTGDWNDLLSEAQHVLKGQPDHLQAIEAELHARCAGTSAEGCRDLYRQASEQRPSVPLYNDFAWQSLIAGDASDATDVAAIKAVIVGRGAASLNTLAAVQAARGHLKQAYETLLSAVDEAGLVRASDLLVLGRIAAGAGYPTRARELYSRVEPLGRPENPTTNWALAQRWLRELP